MYRVDLDRQQRAEIVQHLVEQQGLDREDAEALAPHLQQLISDVIRSAHEHGHRYLASMMERPQLRALSTERFFQLSSGALCEAFKTLVEKLRLQAEEANADAS